MALLRRTLGRECATGTRTRAFNRSPFLASSAWSPPDGDGMPRYPSPSSISGCLRGADYFGTVVFAVSGSVTAASCGMDCLGASIVGTITAVGGGTFRDAIILGKQPFWLEESEYFIMAAAAAAAAFFMWPSMPAGNVIKDKEGGEGTAMLYGDAVGVAAFAVIGAMNGVRAGVHPVIAATCGMVTATFGGMTRDVLCDHPPRILHSHTDMYATTAFAGGAVYVGARATRAPLGVRILSGFAVAFALRVAAFKYDVRLPTWSVERP